jgi:hypothetical protein
VTIRAPVDVDVLGTVLVTWTGPEETREVNVPRDVMVGCDALTLRVVPVFVSPVPAVILAAVAESTYALVTASVALTGVGTVTVLVKVEVPPTLSAPPIPTPPVTTRAPVNVDVLGTVLVTWTGPLEIRDVSVPKEVMVD